MKLLVFLVCVSVASASFTTLQRDAGDEVEKAVVAALDGMRLHGPRLDEVVPGYTRSLEVIQLEHQLQGQIAEMIREYLDHFLSNVQHTADVVQQISNDILITAQHLLSQLDGGNIQHLALEFLTTLHDKYQEMMAAVEHSLEKGVLTTSLLTLAGGLGGSLISNLINQIDFGSIFNSLGDTISGIFGKRELTDDDGRILSTIWSLFTDTLGSIINGLSDKYSAFKEWIQSTLQVGIDIAQPHIDNIKELASQVLANIGTMSTQAIIQALNFFRPWQDLLGPIWDKLMEVGGNLLP